MNQQLEPVPIALLRERIAGNLGSRGVDISPDDPELTQTFLDNDPYLQWMTHEEQLLYASSWARKLGSPDAAWNLIEDLSPWNQFIQWLWTFVRPFHPEGKLTISILEREGIGRYIGGQ